MEAGILPMQYEFCIVFIWGKSSYNLFQLTVYMGNLFATSKWNGYVTVHKNCSYDSFINVCDYLPCAYRDEFGDRLWKTNNR